MRGVLRGVLAQARVELALTLRRGESLLVAIGIPIGVLVFFSLVDVLPQDQEPIDFLVPGVMALSVISSAMTNLAIATGFERQSGVLRRIGITPLGRSGLLAAKLAVLLAVVVLQVVAVALVGVALGWSPAGTHPAAVAMLLLGVVAFAAIGFVLAGRLRAETNLAAANGLFLVFLLLGGIVVETARLPGALRSLSNVLPTDPFVTGLRSALAGSADTSALVALAAWAAVGALVAVRAFRWD